MDQGGRLGTLTFVLLAFRRLTVFIVFTLLLIAVLIGQNYLPADTSAVVATAIFPLVGLDLLILAGALFMAYLEYSHYGIVKGPEEVKITRGVWSIEEIGVPYRRIKEVKVERSVTDQMVGSGTLIITTLSGDEAGDVESITLPYLAKAVAEDFSNGLLNSAEVEKVDVEPESVPLSAAK